MNYNNDTKKNTNTVNEFLNEKIIISNKNYYCSNCNKRGHTYNKCYEPIISNGIISLYIDDFDNSLIPLLEDYIMENIKKKFSDIKNSGANLFHKKIKFLMVQRKHSLGYMEFMRGRYNVENVDEIQYLFKQMTPTEIREINGKDFDYLWNMLWDSDPNSTNTIKKKQHYKEYIISKQKFYELKMNNNKILITTKPTFNFNEWGFPKGRREIYESDIVCAMREFEEETNYNENEYTVLDELNVIKENLVGTNGINYRHNYFLAIVHNNQISEKENKEIADIKFMNIDDCISIIRPYHHNKQLIVKKIHNLIQNFLIEYSNKVDTFTNSHV
jgi:hypothetical protein